jgi:translocator protein
MWNIVGRDRSNGERGLGRIVGAIKGAVIGVLQPLVGAVRAMTVALAQVVQRAEPITDVPTTAVTTRDRLRRVLNLLLSIAQFASAALVFSSERGNQLFYDPSTRDPLIVPADYTFAVWSVIFPTSIIYGIYQALPRNGDNELLRRIGFWTAFAFGCLALWSPATLLDPVRYTVPLFFGALVGLIVALYQISRLRRPLTRSETWCVLVPLSIFAAWCTVGTIANTSTSLFALGYTDIVFSEQTWAVIMLIVGGLISSLMTIVGRGNVPYALTIIWALIGIVVANVTERDNPVVATVAGIVAAGVALVLVGARRIDRARQA